MDNIEILIGPEAFRRKPEMYIGDVSPVSLYRYALIAFLRSPGMTDLVQSRISFLGDGACRMEASVPMVEFGSIAAKPEQPRLILDMTTVPHGGRFRIREGFPAIHELFLVGCGQIICSLSEALTIECVRDGSYLAAYFTRGGLCEPIIVKERSDLRDQTRVQFLPDRSLFGTCRPDHQSVQADWEKLAPSDVANRPVKFADVDEQILAGNLLNPLAPTTQES